MKRYIFIITAALFGFAFASCTDEVTYEPGPQAEGIQYYFSKDEASAVTITPTTTSIDLTVYRVETSGATTVNIGVSDPSGLITSQTSIPVSFNSGSNKATLSIPLDNTKLAYGVGYPVTFTIPDNTTPYGVATTKVTYTYPIPLSSLGKGTLTEDYYWGGSSNPEILQSDIDPNVFHIKGALKGISGNSEDLVIEICRPGNTYNGVAITKSDLIYYEPCNSGYHHSTYDADIYLLHPSNFTAGKDEAYWSFNRVVEYQANGLPAIVTLGPYYYMYGVGGWNGSQAESITIVFPGVVIKDYTVEATYAGMFTDPDGNVFGEASVAFGSDVANGVAVLVPGDGAAAEEAGVALIEAGDESAVEFNGSSIRLPLPADAATGKYTIVVASMDGGEVQEVSSATFFYQAGSVEIDWDWLVGNWEGLDVSGGDPYPMTVTKKDETTAIFHGIWGTEGDMEGVVDFDAKTVTFKGPIDLGELYGGRLMVAHAGEDGYDDGEFVATLSPAGITVTGMGYYLVGGSYDGYDFGTDTTKMTKAE